MKLFIRTLGVIALLALFGAANGLRAHHAFEAEYDASKVITITGTVTRWEIFNPAGNSVRTTPSPRPVAVTTSLWASS